MEFNYRLIHFECACGTERGYVKVGVSSLGELTAQWICSKCEKHVMARIPLEDIIRDLPDHPGVEFSPKDKVLLGEMYITLEET